MVAVGKVIGVNVGDSRIYGISASKQTTQLTLDDTLAGYLGRRESKGANISEKGLVQFVGMGDGIEPHIITTHERDVVCSRVVRQSKLSPEERLKFAAEMANETFAHSKSRRLISSGHAADPIGNNTEHKVLLGCIRVGGGNY